MHSFESYFSENEILRQICKVRIKLSKRRSKQHLLHLLTSNEKYNYHIKGNQTPKNAFEEHQKNLNDLLASILPPRKKWVKLGEASRKKPNRSKEFLTSNDKNFYALLKTIKVHERKKSIEPWFIKLKKFVSEIQSLATSRSYQVSSPIIFPKIKNSVSQECRPICIYSLQDRIILSLTNKFLTQLLDNEFQKSSFAFRSKRNEEGKILSHHDCVREIVKYRKENIDKDLFVVECDMKSFYDTVNHKRVSIIFKELIEKVQKKNPDIDLSHSRRIFHSYLRSYAFNHNVPKSTEVKYWKSYSLIGGSFKWVDSEVSKHYTDYSTERIGVPQGGALSGLIANIYLDFADKELSKLKVLYIRFCDDMIIISSSLPEVQKAKEKYINALYDLQLFPHTFKNESELKEINEGILSIKPFWVGKSKGPYKWDTISSNGFPWIGFVGYEINLNGDLRVRKKSLEKELAKQKKVIKEIESAIKKGMRKPKGTATESAINRLIGMSVGRIGLDNFEEVSTDSCWKNGFKELSLNVHSSRQIKSLDRNRSKLYYRLLSEINDSEIEETRKNKRQKIHYNKPFSYFYQVLEREKKN